MDKTKTETIELDSMPPAAVALADIKWFRLAINGIVARVENYWGDKKFIYLSPKQKEDDYNKLIKALQRFTKNSVMQFNAEEKPVVPIYRIRKIVIADQKHKRIELEIEGCAGRQWFIYKDVETLNSDHAKLLELMNAAGQS